MLGFCRCRDGDTQVVLMGHIALNSVRQPDFGRVLGISVVGFSPRLGVAAMGGEHLECGLVGDSLQMCFR